MSANRTQAGTWSPLPVPFFITAQPSARAWRDKTIVSGVLRRPVLVKQ